MAIELTREELFKQIWERPMTKVAAEYGISDVALKKICVKHRIPVPGRGYWAKKAAGKRVDRAHFRALAEPAVNRVVIHGSGVHDLPEVVKTARRAARAREQHTENRITVVSMPTDLHPRVEKTKKRLEKAKRSDKELVAISGPAFFDLSVGSESIERASAFLSALAIAAEARGHKIAKGDRAPVFVIEDEVLEIKIIEQIAKSKHVPTEAELAAIAKWEERQQRRNRSWGYSSWTPRPTPPEWDYAPSGNLRVLINEGQYGYNGLRKSFGDGKTQRLENLVNAILEAFATWSAAIKAKRIEDERRRQEREEERRRWEEQRRRNALEGKRVEALLKSLERWEQRRRILDLVAAVEARLSTDHCADAAGVQEWIACARAHADRLDPLSEGLPRLLQVEDFKSWELGY